MESKFHALKDKQALGWVSLVLLLVLALSACAGGNAQPAATVAPTATTAPPATAMPTEMPTEVMATEMPTEMPTAASEEATINVATDSNLGQILVDGEGMTLYMFTKDTMDTSNCSGKCLESWPPLLTQGSPKLGAGVDPAMIGSADLPDGTKIVTYNHMPLYYYIKDSKAGDINGQDVNKSWYVVSPDGMAVGYHPEPTINVATDPTLGQILVDQDGMTLYMFAKDTMDTSSCSGQCLDNWPPLLTSGSPQAGDGVDASMLGSTTLADGTLIVTYNHMPLYHYIKDSKPGDVNGQGVGTSWYVVAPDGMAVGK